MSSINKVFLTGTVGRSDYSTSAKGVGILRFSLVTTKYIKKDDGYDQKATWHNLTLFGKTATSNATRIVKGAKVGIEGELENGSYEKDGIKHNTTSIIVTNVDILKYANSGIESNELDGSDQGESDEVPF